STLATTSSEPAVTTSGATITGTSGSGSVGSSGSSPPQEKKNRDTQQMPSRRTNRLRDIFVIGFTPSKIAGARSTGAARFPHGEEAMDTLRGAAVGPSAPPWVLHLPCMRMCAVGVPRHRGGGQGGTRTLTPCGTGFSVQRVYQFRHLPARRRL